MAGAGPEPAPASARPWTRPLLISVTALAAMAVLTLATIVQSPSAKAGSDTGSTADASTPKATATRTTTPSAAAATTTPSTAPTATSDPAAAAATRTTAGADAAVTAAVRALGVSGNVSVAVTEAGAGTTAGVDADTGTATGTVTPVTGAYATGATSYDTASIVKVDILATLLLQDQKAGTHLTATQKTLATAMIEQSDNDAALDLWHDIGRGAGLATANASFGLDHTVGGDGDLWGLTQTTASDQIALLHAVFDSDSPLSSSSRAYISGLMGSVVDGERWGVSAADSDSSGYALKNGWLQRSATGLWDINSIGEVSYDGNSLLVSVLSSGQQSEQGGIDQVERVAAAAARAYVAAA
ncbi:putative secreted protein [Actinacidiphila reveromycinica]|uniref:Putative secreted protein n=1 Tax=Actinacidiphila reveromycinica TaxID=659352 RepID=A0A7U3UQP2_9ACTN|nr:putative secreted protein [Streptomyces sp. SN-593]